MGSKAKWKMATIENCELREMGNDADLLLAEPLLAADPVLGDVASFVALRFRLPFGGIPPYRGRKSVRLAQSAAVEASQMRIKSAIARPIGTSCGMNTTPEDLSVWPTGQTDIDDAPCVDLRSRPSKTAEDAMIGILIEEQSHRRHGRVGCAAVNRARRSAFRARVLSRRRATSVSWLASSASTSER